MRIAAIIFAEKWKHFESPQMEYDSSLNLLLFLMMWSNSDFLHNGGNIVAVGKFKTESTNVQFTHSSQIRFALSQKRYQQHQQSMNEICYSHLNFAYQWLIWEARYQQLQERLDDLQWAIHEHARKRMITEK